MNHDEKRRVAVMCANCGEVAAARLQSDGTIEPIGSENVCNCENGYLQVVDENDSFETSK